MTKLNENYKCDLCGNIVSVSHFAAGELFCCGKKMPLLLEKTKEELNEKHVPIVEKKENGILVKIGSVQHPMTAEHYIEWVEVIAGDKVFKQYLHPDAKPECFFAMEEKKFTVREYCNLHGLWKGEFDLSAL